jgi:xanthine dehydrogenase accessory factor
MTTSAFGAPLGMTDTMTTDLFATAAKLRADRTPFVWATVVASYPPQSVRPGAKAIVHADGTVDGWVGGGCVRPVVLQESADALADGRPRLVRLNAPPNAESADSEPTRHGDVREYPMTCQGEGGIEVYLEPILATPRLVLLGHTPVVQSLARLGAELGFEVVVGSSAVPADLFPPGVRVSPNVTSALAGADATTWVVVGTMGAGDEEALTAAAESDAAYIGLVASRKKARVLIDYVRGSGMSPERLARVKYPAGLDLGGMGAAEIALSVLAEIVQRRYGKGTGSEALAAEPKHQQESEPVPLGRGGASEHKHEAFPIDPVCGMPVDPATARHTVIDGDRTIYFCCASCKATYLRRHAELA